MATTAHGPRLAAPVATVENDEPAYQAFQILHWGFVAAPVIAGADKFLHVLTNWDAYLSPTFAKISPLSTHGTMMVVGVIEILAGLIVALRPRIGAYVVAAWLAGIIVNTFLLGRGYDIALRDFGLLLGALALGRLSARFDHKAARLPERIPERAALTRK
ncbi:MAG: hypothetical protein ABIP39_14235 [Polyangiaceae bacterium]